MKLFFHHCSQGFSNCYVLGTDFPPDTPSSVPGSKPKESSLPKEAIIIDPGNMDSNLLNLIEKNDYTLKGILVTHDHLHHVRGVITLMRIYNTKVYAINPVVCGYPATIVRDGEKISIGPFKVEVFSIPGHSADSAVYKIDRFLFTGDVMNAGLMGNTGSSYAAANQVSALRKKILSLPGDYKIFPGHGPPSSLEAERRFNLDLNFFEHRKNRRPFLGIEL